MSIIIITGSYPPDICGVGDYTARIMQRDWTLYYRKDWGIGSFFRYIRDINKLGIKTINMQYPTQGYGWSIVPHLLCIYFSLFTRKRFSVTIHEQSQLSLKARWAQKLILLTANRVIFTNDFERSYAIKRFPFMRGRSTVIKIFSNISAVDHIRPISEREYEVVNFGHVRPNKGLEEFIEKTKGRKACIAGQVPEGFEEYFEKIKSSGVEIKLNLSDRDVSELLNNTKLVYLPFPDGVSQRRGSFLASAINGAVVYTTIGKFTTPQLNDAVLDSAEISIDGVLNNDELMNEKQRKGLEFMRTQMPKSWADVAEQYNEFLR